MRPSFENIPAELTGHPQWVCWKAIKRDNGKTDKKPINPHTGELAKTNDPSTWGSYADTVTYYRRQKNNLAGIGFVFAKKDPYAGIDLDDCINTEGTPLPWASKVLEDFSTYAEVSPSGTGIKIFCKGNVFCCR